jgi:hypothetical protein
MGMESVMAEQFRVLLEESLLVDIADTAIFDYPNISVLAEYLLTVIPFSEIERQELSSTVEQEETSFLAELALLAMEDLQEVQAMSLEEVVCELSTLVGE